MANAVAGIGTLFERWGGLTWDTIAEINSIEGPDEDREIIETTTLDTADGYDEFITGFLDGGTLALNMNFIRSGYEVMKQDFEVNVARSYRITLPDDEETTLEFDGLVTEIPITMEAEDRLTADVTIQITSDITLASAGAESYDSLAWSSGSTDADLEVYIQGLSTPLSDDMIAKLYTFLVNYKSDEKITNLSEIFDVFYYLGNETAESSLRNLVERDHDAVAVNSPVFTPYEGWTGDGISACITSDFNPSESDVINFKQNDASIGVYARALSETVTVSGLSCSDAIATALIHCGMVASQAVMDRVYLNASTYGSADITVANGMLIKSRSTSSAVHNFCNGSYATGTRESTGVPDATLILLGSATSYTDAQLSLAFMGKHLSEARCGTLQANFETLMDANGKGVIG